MLKFSVLFGALAIDMVLERRQPGKGRVLGMLMVLGGVSLAASVGAGAAVSAGMGSVIMGVLASLASGMGFVLSARFCMPRLGADAVSTAFVSFMVSACLQSPAWMASWFEDSGFVLRLQDLHLWIFVVLQGVFYTRSFQILPTQISYAATFTLSLASQLISAAMLDMQTMGVAKGTGLVFVFVGAVASEIFPE
jgi:hypothetical protein